jgi:hypothetical protein
MKPHSKKLSRADKEMAALIRKCQKKSIVTSSAFVDVTVQRTEDIVATADVETFFNDMRKREF